MPVRRVCAFRVEQEFAGKPGLADRRGRARKSPEAFHPVAQGCHVQAKTIRRLLVMAASAELDMQRQRPGCGRRWWPGKSPHPSGWLVLVQGGSSFGFGFAHAVG